MTFLTSINVYTKYSTGTRKMFDPQT